MLTHMDDVPNRIATPAGWRDDGPNIWGRPQLPPNCAWDPATGTWESPRRCIPQPVDGEDWYVWGDEDYSSAYCTPSRRRSLTAQPAAHPQQKPIVYAQYDPAFDPDLHPELDAPKPVKPAKAPAVQPVPAEPAGIPVAWPTRIVTPVPLSFRT